MSAPEVVTTIPPLIEAPMEYEAVLVLPSEAVLGLNIRTINPAFVDGLATSIRQQGQIHECTGDTLPDGTTRIWAGQHRFAAVQKINEENAAAGEAPMLLRVRRWPTQLTPDAVLALQLAENLQNHMNPDEEAKAIKDLWDLYIQVFEGERVSMADLARRIGRGEAKVRNALAFAGSDVSVQELVKRGALMYSLGVEVARLPQEKQLAMAVKIIQLNLSRSEAELMIKRTLGEDSDLPGLFAGQQFELDRENHRIAFRTAADRAARDAAGYLIRIIHLVRVLDARSKHDMTDTIQDILARLSVSVRKFEEMMMAEAPVLAGAILDRATAIEQELESTELSI